MKLGQVSKSCFAVLNQKNRMCDANSGLINLGGGVVIDTQSDLPHARQMIELFGKVWPRMPRRVINGYFFRILTAQGKFAAGRAKSYLVDGRMTGGFALVAWPAQYAKSGVMTFAVNRDGTFYEKDLGRIPRSGQSHDRLRPGRRLGSGGVSSSGGKRE